MLAAPGWRCSSVVLRAMDSSLHLRSSSPVEGADDSSSDLWCRPCMAQEGALASLRLALLSALHRAASEE